MFKAYCALMRLDKPIGNLLLLWPTWIALWLASNGTPSFKLWLIYTVGVLLMRAAGCVINDYFDRDFDKHVQRTKDRPLAIGAISPNEALRLFAFLILFAFILVWQTNWLTIQLSVAAFILATIYPLMKRYTHWPQVVLGLAFAMAIPMAYGSVMNQVPGEALILVLATVLWALAYDTLYAMVDKKDDLLTGIKSSAIAMGRFDRQFVWLCHLSMLLLLMWIGSEREFQGIFQCSVLLAFGLALYQQKLVKKNQAFKAFLNNAWLGGVLFIGVLLEFVLQGMS